MLEYNDAVNYSWTTFQLRRTDTIAKALAGDESTNTPQKKTIMQGHLDHKRIKDKIKKGFKSKVPGKSKNTWVKPK